MERVDYESLIIQDLLNFHRDGSLDTNPWYQRRSVWNGPQKAYLINTLHERKPVPTIYIRHQIDLENEKSLKEVVDGQQRIKSIISYRNDEFPARHPEHKSKVLFSQLSSSEKRAFLGTALSIGYLIGASDQDVVEIFGRINSISKTLNPQEKRNAKYSGEFKQFSLKQAADRLPFWRHAQIFSATDISRMQEVQFVSDLIINMLEGLSDFSASVIDRYYYYFDNEFTHAEDIDKRIEHVFSILLSLPIEAFSNTIFRSPDILFSLILSIDELRDRPLATQKVKTVIYDIDNLITGLRDQSTLSSMETDILQSFTSGNLHRIKARKGRKEVISVALS